MKKCKCYGSYVSDSLELIVLGKVVLRLHSFNPAFVTTWLDLSDDSKTKNVYEINYNFMKSLSLTNLQSLLPDESKAIVCRECKNLLYYVSDVKKILILATYSKMPKKYGKNFLRSLL